MPIICLEGPSAVGKSTISVALAAVERGYVVQDVNTLFDRPANARPDWYLQRQADRWQIATVQARSHQLVVLDGDPFQPLWYNSVYDQAGLEGLDFLEEFYRPRILSGSIAFPDRYVLLNAPVDVLRVHKSGDPTRRRRRFEAHLGFIEPQREYFRAMESFSPGRVFFVEAGNLSDTVRAVSSAVQEIPPGDQSVELFDRLIGWLREPR